LVADGWRVVFAKAAQKDTRNVAAAGLKEKVDELLAILRDDPYRSPPPFEKLVGDLAGFYSRRINRQHRLVYKIDPTNRTVQVLRMWSHYE
jgi:Txe/YoeB family toxin of toxin-antitoxin system